MDTKSLFTLCDLVIAAKKNAVRLRTEGDFVKFSHKVAEAELRDSEAELKEALRSIYKTEGKEKFAEIVKVCDSYMIKLGADTQEIEISYFRNVKDTTPTNVFLSTFLFSAKHRQSINELRNVATKAEKDDKKKSMPCATISGTFKVRNIAGIEKYNGIACMDFDEKDNDKTAEEMKAILSKMTEVYYAGLSIGGKGVFAIIKTDNQKVECHSQVIEAIGESLKEVGLNYDISGKDVSRLRFISYDPQPYFNAASEYFKTAFYLQPKPKAVIVKTIRPQAERDSTREQVEKVVEKIESGLIDLTTDYADWVNLGFAIANEFGYDGEKYFLRVSQYHPKFDPNEAGRKYRNFVKENKSIRIGTFFYFCKDNGISIN